MNYSKYTSLVAGSLLAVALIAVKSKADTTDSNWGDLGYSHPTPEVEAIPMSMDSAEKTAANSEVTAPKETVDVSANLVEPSPVESADVNATAGATGPVTELPKEEAPTRSNISTVQNTYGVETEEKTPITLFVSPFAGVASVFGNDTSDSSPLYAVGGTVGVLVSSNMRLDVNYTYDEMNFSNPRVNNTAGIFTATDSGVFKMKQSSLTGGVKLYILGRESRFRPFIGGGAGYTRGTLNYSSAYLQALNYQSQYTSDFTINQVTGFGELGTEFAISKNIVASAAFRLNGVLSSNSSGTDATTASNYDANKLTVGDSLSRTASYLVSAGLGIYF